MAGKAEGGLAEGWHMIRVFLDLPVSRYQGKLEKATIP